MVKRATAANPARRCQKSASKPERFPPFTEGEGKPYAPVDWPEKGDVWGWRVGSRVSSVKYYTDRYLIAPSRLWKRPRKKMEFGSKTKISEFVRTEFRGKDEALFWASFTWEVPAEVIDDVEGAGDVDKKRKVVAVEVAAMDKSCSEGQPDLEEEYEEEREVAGLEVIAEAAGDREEGGDKRRSKRRKRKVVEAKDEGPTETPLEVSVRRIQALKLRWKREAEEKQKEEEKERTRRSVRPVFARRRTRSARREALSQPIGMQFHNTSEDPILIDDDEPKERRFLVCDVEIVAPTFYRGGRQCMRTDGLIEAIDKILPTVTAEQRRRLEDRRAELVSAVERRAARQAK